MSFETKRQELRLHKIVCLISTASHSSLSRLELLEIEGLWPHLMRDVRVRDVPMRDLPAPVGRTGDVRTTTKFQKYPDAKAL